MKPILTVFCWRERRRPREQREHGGRNYRLSFLILVIAFPVRWLAHFAVRDHSLAIYAAIGPI